MRELEDNFKQSGGFYKDFRIGDLFEKIDFKKLPYKKSELPTQANKEFCLPAVTCQTLNQGISCYVPKQGASIFKNMISVAANGDAPAFYQPKEFTILQDAYVLRFKNNKLNSLQYLYMTALLQKILIKFNWSNKSGWEKVKQEYISLPVLPLDSNKIESINADSHNNYKIAFDYMESFIRELEAERLKELEAYLQASGLKDYKLADSERQALQGFMILNNKTPMGGQLNAPHSLEGLSFKDFRIGDLFSVKSNPQLNKDSFIFSDNGEYPYFTRTCINNGIAGYVEYLDEEHKIKGNSIAIGMLGMQFFYMQKDFYAGQFTKTIYPKFTYLLNARIAHYFIAQFNKKQTILQGVLVRDFEKTFINEKIILPIYSNGEIAFDFIETFIQALQKEAIKDVVLWSEKELKATKDVINRIS